MYNLCKLLLCCHIYVLKFGIRIEILKTTRIIVLHTLIVAFLDEINCSIFSSVFFFNNLLIWGDYYAIFP